VSALVAAGEVGRFDNWIGLVVGAVVLAFLFVALMKSEGS
jgi:hypothetical protein